MTRIGSLCSGYGGLDLGLAAALGVEVAESVAWHAEYEAAPSAVLAHHWPQVPNLHDLTLVDWDDIEPVDWLTAGYPCQPFSQAGQRKGEDDDRHLWPYVAEAIRVLRPGHVLLENVAGHRSLGFGRVIADLAAVGYVGSWHSLRASDVGAPHQRERVFILAADAYDKRQQGNGASGRLAQFPATPGDRPPVADTQNLGHERARDPRLGRDGSANDSHPTSDTEGFRWREGWPEPAGKQGGHDLAERRLCATSDALGSRRDGRAPEPLGCQVGRAATAGAGEDIPADSDSAYSPGLGHSGSSEAGGIVSSDRVIGCSEDSAHGVEWGSYEPAIRRWERVLGRVAPAPTAPGRRGGQQLAPQFVEWMMGLPAGHVTDVSGLSRNEMLKVLGNGVVPHQAAEAVRWLLARQEANV